MLEDENIKSSKRLEVQEKKYMESARRLDKGNHNRNASMPFSPENIDLLV